MSAQIDIKDQEYCSSLHDSACEASFLIDDPTVDITITLFDDYAVNRGSRGEDMTVVGQVLIPLSSFYAPTGAVSAGVSQWYELLPPALSLVR